MDKETDNSGASLVETGEGIPPADELDEARAAADRPYMEDGFRPTGGELSDNEAADGELGQFVNLPYMEFSVERAKAAAREQRWRAPARSRVSHPKYGSVIVPHASNLAATMNAAEFWHCDLMEIISEAKVDWIPQNQGPLRKPREFCK